MKIFAFLFASALAYPSLSNQTEQYSNQVEQESNPVEQVSDQVEQEVNQFPQVRRRNGKNNCFFLLMII